MKNTEKIVNARIIQVGDAIGIVIPKRNCIFSGLKKGDRLNIWYKKVEVENGTE